MDDLLGLQLEESHDKKQGPVKEKRVSFGIPIVAVSTSDIGSGRRSHSKNNSGLSNIDRGGYQGFRSSSEAQDRTRNWSRQNTSNGGFANNITSGISAFSCLGPKITWQEKKAARDAE
jgi:hypothetical protein